MVWPICPNRVQIDAHTTHVATLNIYVQSFNSAIKCINIIVFTSQCTKFNIVYGNADIISLVNQTLIWFLDSQKSQVTMKVNSLLLLCLIGNICCSSSYRISEEFYRALNITCYGEDELKRICNNAPSTKALPKVKLIPPGNLFKFVVLIPFLDRLHFSICYRGGKGPLRSVVSVDITECCVRGGEPWASISTISP